MPDRQGVQVRYGRAMISDRQAQRVPRTFLKSGLLANTVFLVSSGHFLLEVLHQYLPVFFPLFRAEYGLSYEQIGMVTLVGATTMSLAQPVFGYFIDRWDARRVTAFSVIWLGLVMALVGFSDSYWTLMAAVALAGFGSAAFHPAGASVISKAAAGVKTGRAVSFFAVGGNLGSAISPLLLAVGLGLLGLKGTIVLLPVVIVAGIWLVGGARAREYGRPRGAPGAAVASGPGIRSRSCPNYGCGNDALLVPAEFDDLLAGYAGGAGLLGRLRRADAVRVFAVYRRGQPVWRYLVGQVRPMAAAAGQFRADGAGFLALYAVGRFYPDPRSRLRQRLDLRWAVHTRRRW